ASLTQTASAPRVAERRRRPWWLRPDARTGLLFVLPTAVLFLAFRFGPALFGTLLSFTDYTIGADPEWSGLNNFQRLPDHPTFWQSVRVTVVYTALVVPLSLLASLAMALLTRRASRATRFYRSVFFLPVVTSLVLAGVIFTWVFGEGGPVAKLLGTSSWLA